MNKHLLHQPVEKVLIFGWGLPTQIRLPGGEPLLCAE
jgi:hypothetical protein